jgi:hypothetical protein
MHRLPRLVIGFLGLVFAASGVLMLIRIVTSPFFISQGMVEGVARILFGGVTVAWALRRSAKAGGDPLIKPE